MRLRNKTLHLLPLALILLSCAGDSGKQDISGAWLGTLEYPGFKSRIAFEISRSSGGELKASLRRPDQDDDRLPATSVVFQDGRLQLEAASLRASFDGRIRRLG